MKETRAGSGGRAKQDYWGALVLLNADGQSFDTVMAAINSSKCASCDITLIVERKKGEPSKVSSSVGSACRSDPMQDVPLSSWHAYMSLVQTSLPNTFEPSGIVSSTYQVYHLAINSFAVIRSL